MAFSENELCDILCIDNDVLDEVFEYYESSIRIFPIGLWCHIKEDIKDYIVEKNIDDTKVIYW